MSLFGSTRLLAAGAIWRLTGAAGAGETLIEAACSEDETQRTLAAMLLVRAGDRSVAPLEQALTRGKGTPELVDMLASIGTERAREGLASLSGLDGEVGEEARAALVTLEEIQQRKPKR